MKKKLIASLAAIAALGTSFIASAAIEKNQLTVWVNGDKGYNGIAKVAEKYTAKTGVKVTVAHPAQPELQFQQAAAIGSGPDIFLGAMTATASGQAQGLSHLSSRAPRKRRSSLTLPGTR